VDAGSVDLTLKGKYGYVYYVYCLRTLAESYKNTTYAVSARALGQTSASADTSTTDLSYASASANPNNYQDTAYTTDLNQIVNNSLGNTAADTWYASRALTLDATDKRARFGAVYTGSGATTGAGGIKLYDAVHNGSNTAYEVTKGFRAVVKLKSGLSVSGSGTSSSPYTLN